MMEHCNPEELLSIARKGGRPDRAAARHMKSCVECERLWQLVERFAQAKEVHLAHAPSSWIERAVALAAAPRPLRGAVEKLARLTFDSWAAPDLAGLRGAPGERTRRLRWEWEDWQLELRAETTSEGWDCTAQLQSEGRASPGIAVQFNSDQVPTDAAGMALWSGKRPPRRIMVGLPDGRVHVESVGWKRHRNS